MFQFLRSVRFWLGIVISMICLALAFRQLDWTKTIGSLSSANWLLVMLGIGMFIATYAGFAMRWKVLLSPSARLSALDTFSYIMIGYLANIVLPLRPGDVARATLLGRRNGIGVSLVLGSVALERTLDVITVLVMALGLCLVIDIPPVVRSAIAIFAVGGLTTFGVLFFLARNSNRLPWLVARMPGFVPRGSAERLLRLITHFADGLRTLRNMRQLSVTIIFSALAWAIAGVGTIVYVRAFGFLVPWYAGLFVLVVINLGGAIPSSPGAVGVYHYLAVLALSVWLTDKSAALGYAIGTHGVSLAVNASLGAICLWRDGLSVGRLSKIRIPSPDSQSTGRVA